MPTKCIYMHTYEEFTMWRCIQAYKGNANVYRPLWTPTYICAIWTYFLIILYIFPLLFFPQKTLSLPISLTIAWQTFPIITASCMTSPPYILLFTPHSPVICKDNFPLVYMYKSSRYYAVVQWLIWVLFSLGQPLSKSWHQLHCSHQAFLATIASDFLVLPPSPFIAIYIRTIFTQHSHLLLKGYCL